MSQDRIVCPLSIMSNQPKACHPSCKFLNDDNECMLAKYLQQKTEEKDKD